MLVGETWPYIRQGKYHDDGSIALDTAVGYPLNFSFSNGLIWRSQVLIDGLTGGVEKAISAVWFCGAPMSIDWRRLKSIHFVSLFVFSLKC